MFYMAYNLPCFVPIATECFRWWLALVANVTSTNANKRFAWMERLLLEEQGKANLARRRGAPLRFIDRFVYREKLMAPTPLHLALRPDDLPTLAFAGVIGKSLEAKRRPLIRGLDEDIFTGLVSEYFPGFDYPNGTPDPAESKQQAFDLDEFDDLLDLLLEHRATNSRQEAWLAHAIATASMGQNHLWQDMGLPDRQALSSLLMTYFPALAMRNTKDMKWKKFFYRQLCERSGILICKSPRCADCCDFRLCFGAEGAE